MLPQAAEYLPQPRQYWYEQAEHVCELHCSRIRFSKNMKSEMNACCWTHLLGTGSYRVYHPAYRGATGAELPPVLQIPKMNQNKIEQLQFDAMFHLVEDDESVNFLLHAFVKSLWVQQRLRAK